MSRYVLSVMQKILVLSIAMLTIAGCGNGSNSGFTASGLTAEEIITQMRQAYANCRTYQDTGVVNVTYNQNSGITSSDEITFSTAFVRPNRFRFEYKDFRIPLEPRYIIWSDGSEVLSWWDMYPGIKTEDSLSMAIASATGVSEGSAATTPSLLISDQIGLYFCDIAGAQRLDDDAVDGFNCYRIYGTSGGDSITLWIDTKTLLIRRLKTHNTLTDYSYDTTTTYTPLVDGDVTDAMLAFNPPQ